MLEEDEHLDEVRWRRRKAEKENLYSGEAPPTGQLLSGLRDEVRRGIPQQEAEEG